jgi:hypothetical protein
MYFLGEAADIFSYLMGIANEHSLRLKQEHGQNFSFMETLIIGSSKLPMVRRALHHAELIKKYPCAQCVILNACEAVGSLMAPISPA